MAGGAETSHIAALAAIARLEAESRADSVRVRAARRAPTH